MSSGKIFGAAGEMYRAAVQAGTLARTRHAILDVAVDFHERYTGDEVAFRAAFRTFLEAYLARIDEALK